MKIKNTKVICFIYMITMAIGLAILVYNPVGLTSQDKDDSVLFVARKANKGPDEGKQDKDSINLMSTAADPTPSVTPSPTSTPIPTPLPVYPLEEKGYPSEIDELAKTYYEAKVSCDIDTLKNISSEPENVYSKKQLLKLIEGIDEYQNIKCYVKKSYEEDAYIVFVYYDIKFIGLNTLAPSLSKLYIVKDETGEWKTFDDELTEELWTYIAARSEDEDVLALRKHTDQLAEEAKDKDKDLKAFWEILDKY
jgi:hypothetical protein